MQKELEELCEDEYYAELVKLTVEAIHCESILSRFPNIIDAVEHLVKERKIDELVAIYPRILESGHSECIESASHIFKYLDNQSFAESCYRKLIQLEPQNPFHHLELCRALLKQGKKSQAKKMHNEAWKLYKGYHKKHTDARYLKDHLNSFPKFTDLDSYANVGPLEEICKGYVEFMHRRNRNKVPTEITDRYNPTKEQVLEFSKSLARYYDLHDFQYYTAAYLTALMQSSRDNEFEIDLSELNRQGWTFHNLGYRLQGKKLTVNGNAGQYLGHEAENSRIDVNGNAGDYVGLASKNSQITVNGNAGEYLGNRAEESIITVNRAGNGIGALSKNSKIYIKGSLGLVAAVIGEGTGIYQEQQGKWVRVPLLPYPGARLETEKEPKTSSIDDICKGYQEYMGWKEKEGKIPTEITKRYKPTKEQVLEFSRALIKYKDLPDFLRYTGNYFAALMQSSNDQEFVIDMAELNKAGKDLHFLGLALSGKNLTVSGNAGGSVGNHACNSQIIVDGNAGNAVGINARNSQIIVNGNVGYSIGDGTENCRIYIKGTYKSLSQKIGKGTEIYQVQNGKWVRVNAAVKKDSPVSSLEEICKGYQEYMGLSDKGYEIPTEITNRYKPTKEQVLEFSRALAKYKDLPDFLANTADYLAALMHSSKDKDFVLDLTELNKTGNSLNFLGYGLKGKTLTIIGDAGDWTGYDAENSNISVNGNAGNWAGHCAKDSTIIISNNAGSGVGSYAKKTKITVNGNAGARVGAHAVDSKIYIKGGYADPLSNDIGENTEIYQEQNRGWVRVHPK